MLYFLQSYQQCRRVPVSLHSHQHLLLFVFLIEVIIFDEAATCKPVSEILTYILTCSLSSCNIHWHFYKNIHHKHSTKIKSVMNNNNSSARLVFTNFIFKIMDSRREKKGVGDSPNVIVVSLFKKLIYFLAVLGLLFSICGKAGISRAVMLGLLVVVASLVVEHRLWAHGLKQLWHTDSVVAAHGP